MSLAIFRHAIKALLLTGVFLPVVAQSESIKVTLLGTGCPPPVMNRFGPSTLVEANGEILLFDAGRGVLQRLEQIKTPLKDVSRLFLTHLHSDHTIGIPDLLLTGWAHGRREMPLQVWGPEGTKPMMESLDRAFDFDIRIRLYDDRPPPQGIVVQTHEINEGVVYEQNGVKVTAFTVDHTPLKPAFGYRVDYNGHSVVLSGDTRFSENLIQHAQGTDVLIHEVASPESFQRADFLPERLKAIVAHHVTPEQAGEVFSRVKPKLAVYSHIALPDATEQDLIPATRKTYNGAVQLGEDLMWIEIGNEITVHKPSP